MNTVMNKQVTIVLSCDYRPEGYDQPEDATRIMLKFADGEEISFEECNECEDNDY